MSSPSIQKIEEKLFEILTSQFSCVVTPIHPKEKNSLNHNDFLVVVNYVSDSFEGSSVTDLILHPRIGFTVYSQSYPFTRSKSEELIEFLDSLSGLEFESEQQKVDVVHRVFRSPIDFDEESGLFLIQIDYRFILSKTVLND